LARGDQLRDDRRLALVQREDQLVAAAVLGDGLLGPAVLVEVGPHALLAPGNEQQLAVEIDIPLGINAELGEGLVEAHAMAVTLGVDEHAVAIEYQRLDHPSRSSLR